jgi:hypothetical protein
VPMGRGINGRSIEICTDGVQHEPKRLSTPVERRRENKQTIWIGAGQIDRGPVYAVESPLQRNVSSAQRALPIMGPSMLEMEEEKKGKHSIYMSTEQERIKLTRRTCNSFNR